MSVTVNFTVAAACRADTLRPCGQVPGWRCGAYLLGVYVVSGCDPRRGRRRRAPRVNQPTGSHVAHYWGKGANALNAALFQPILDANRLNACQRKNCAIFECFADANWYGRCIDHRSCPLERRVADVGECTQLCRNSTNSRQLCTIGTVNATSSSSEARIAPMIASTTPSRAGRRPQRSSRHVATGLYYAHVESGKHWYQWYTPPASSLHSA